jgi:hypothetical protein
VSCVDLAATNAGRDDLLYEAAASGDPIGAEDFRSRRRDTQVIESKVNIENDEVSER